MRVLVDSFIAGQVIGKQLCNIFMCKLNKLTNDIIVLVIFSKHLAVARLLPKEFCIKPFGNPLYAALQAHFL